LGAVVLSLINILKRLIMKGLSDDRDAHQA
jgi:hypothetical protein